MRVLMVSKALVVGAYQQKAAEIAAQPDVERLTVVVPPAWQEPGGRLLRLERLHEHPRYDLRVEPIRFNGNFHLFHWPGLGRVLRDTRPDVVHVDEEPYNLATVLATWQARRVGAAPLFFTWQNLFRRYPPPFSVFERSVYAASRQALAGNADAADVLRRKGYRGRIATIPQFGVDPERFRPGERVVGRTPRVAFVGRLVQEKGLFVLLKALARGPGWDLEVVGDGPAKDDARRAAERLGVAGRVTWVGGVASTAMPERLRSYDLLVLPSLTRPNWKEQFGRILVEAMASGVPVVGSDSGEIPRVIGPAGLVVPEGDPAALAAAITRVLTDSRLWQQLAAAGRERAVTQFSHREVAVATVAVYRHLLGAPVA